MRLKQVIDAALDIIFPISCLGCGSEGTYVCSDCLRVQPRLASPYCSYCAEPGSTTPCRWCRAASLELDGIVAPFLMEGAVREAVLQLKYHQVRGLAPVLGGLMEQEWRSKSTAADLVLPVPLHRSRLRQRGYNQSTLLAKALSKGLGLPCDESALVRTRDTGPQVGLNREERVLNVQGCFRCSAPVEGKSILLVDDVATTGSTLSACGQVLRQAGATSVWGIVLAREGRPSTKADDKSRPFRQPRRRRSGNDRVRL